MINIVDRPPPVKIFKSGRLGTNSAVTGNFCEEQWGLGGPMLSEALRNRCARILACGTLAATSVVGIEPAVGQQTEGARARLFTCQRAVYATVGAGPTTLYEFSPFTGVATPVPGTTRAGGYDAIGLSLLNGHIFGIPRNSPDRNTKLLEIDPVSGTMTEHALSGLPVADTAYSAGTVSVDGRVMFIYPDVANARGPAYEINLDPASGAIGRVMRTFNFLTNASGIGDWAYHPKDGLLYSISALGYLSRHNTATGQNTSRPLLGSSNYRAKFFDDDGNLYFIDARNPQRILRADLTASTAAAPMPLAAVPNATVFGTVQPGLLFTDAAGCLITADFGDAPDSYRTQFTSNGPSHKPADDLLLGPAISKESDARTPLNGLGDNFDDAIPAMPDLPADATTYAVDLRLTNTTGQPATLAGWVDFDRSGTFDPGERQVVPVPDRATTARLSWTTLPPLPAGSTFTRFRIFPGTLADPPPAGDMAGNGEVEDYPMTVSARADLSLTKAVAAN